MKSKLKICHVTSVHPWDDIRIFKKQCVSLAQEFQEVNLVAPNGPNKKVDGVFVHGVKNHGYEGKIKRILKFRKIIIQRALELDADVYQFHDPELLSYVKLLKRKGKKVIYDSHEDVPGTIKTKPWIKFQFLRNAISWSYNIFEKQICKSCDGVISVLPGITNKFTNSNLETIYNYPFITLEKPFKKQPNEIINIVYHGGLTRQRGILELCKSINHIKNVTVKLNLIGKWASSEFQNECLSSVKNSSLIEDHGLNSFEECQEKLSTMDVGMVTLHKTPNYSYSLPIKFYEYVVHGLPIIMSNFEFWEKEFKNAAQFVDPMKPEGIARKIEDVCLNYEKYQELTYNYQSILLKEKSWKVEEKKLINFYKKLLPEF